MELVIPDLYSNWPNSRELAVLVELDWPCGSRQPAGQMEFSAVAYWVLRFVELLLAIASVQL